MGHSEIVNSWWFGSIGGRTCLLMQAQIWLINFHIYSCTVLFQACEEIMIYFYTFLNLVMLYIQQYLSISKIA
jgi:hypothetical protein